MIRKQTPLGRGAGVLLPVTALPSPHGIGTLGREAFRFLDFLKAAGQSYWQVLPLGPTSYGDSPYQSFSAFAGNPYLIDLDLLLEEGLLKAGELDEDFGDEPRAVDYEKLYETRFKVLRLACGRSRHRDTAEYRAFCKGNPWLFDYAFYMALKMHFDAAWWLDWPEELRLREPEALKKWERNLAEEIAFWSFCQFQFYRQWAAVKAYAGTLGIRIIGDLPIYVSLDSADVWVHPEQFQLGEDRLPTAVAGVPPDSFSKTGQLWGNPLYAWERMREDGFSWWKERMAFSAKLFDVSRIDHFIGIVRYYAIPYGDETAENGAWREGPGQALLEAVASVMGKGCIIAEDLGVVVPKVTRLREKFGYPGMKILQFAFDSGGGNPNLPCHYEKNCVAYCGTHDNETMAGFFAHQKAPLLRFARAYLHVKRNKALPWESVRAVYASAADTAVVQAQDLLGLGNEARINFPSTIGGNWRWRLLPDELSPALAKALFALAETYGRLNKEATDASI